MQVLPQRQKVEHHEKQGGQDQDGWKAVGASTRGMIRKLSEPITMLRPGLKKKIDLAHVVRGACHGIAYRLQAVERHAFAEQAGIKLSADLSLSSLSNHFETKGAEELGKEAHQLGDNDDEGDLTQAGNIHDGRADDIVGLTDKNRYHSQQDGVAGGAKKRQSRPPAGMNGVRKDPADGAAAIGLIALGEGEFGGGHRKGNLPCSIVSLPCKY